MYKGIMNMNEYVPVILTFILAITAGVLLIRLHAKRKMQDVRIDYLQSFTNHFKPTVGMEKNLDYLLQKTQELVDAPNYSFYIYNAANHRFTLKAVRQLTLDTHIAPSYSGLLPYEKEKYDPPLSLSMDRLTAEVTVTKEGEVPILTIPIKGGLGIIQIGPVAKVSSKTLKAFEQISELLEVPLRNLMEEEVQRRNYEVLETSAKAVKYMNRLYIHEQMKHPSKQNAAPYIDFLKSVADSIDQLSPFTIGSSKLMSNYSMAIAREMGLSEYQIQTVGLAAYLSNIGTIGISDGLLNKEGVYSDKEYEQMKLHSEVGAAIMENTIALDDVALLVKHHHERMDGNGYPSRLVGENIPLGSRIIAVVQTFLAKINCRSYRDPLPFDEALKLIMDGAGSQLDSVVVGAFINWYETKRDQYGAKNKALGNCWDLGCVPSSICSQCPAYKNTAAKNCWEFERNNCLKHGKTCETCFVYTEAMARIKAKESSRKAGVI